MKRDYETLIDKSNKDYEKRLEKSRKRSAKALIPLIFLFLIAIFSSIYNGFTWDRLILFGVIIFCIYISVRNRRILKQNKSDVTFKTEYLEMGNNTDEYGLIDNNDYESGLIDEDTRDL